MSIFPLICKAQKYAWGKKGSSSFVTKFLEEEVNEDDPYAELWMGVHPSGESFVKCDDESDPIPLSLFLEERKHFRLPFLFKILSIAEPLSIQLHPTKEVAEILHKENPLQYKDDNHKPELAVALTDFEAMCGFRTYREITEFIGEVNELKSLFMFNESDESFLKLEQPEDLKRLFRKLLNCDKNHVKKCLEIALDRIKNKKEMKTREENLFLKLMLKYPNDPCCFCPWIFNYFQLKPGESLFIKPNIPHSYVSGDIIECMANSDNVIRCGLTPKFIDQENLLKITNFSEIDPNSHRLESFDVNEKISYYSYSNKHFKEFQVSRLDVKSEGEEYVVKKNTVALIVSGEGELNDDVKVKAGEVFLLEVGSKLKINSQSQLMMYFASKNNEN